MAKRKGASVLRETGLARLCFSPSADMFEGVLINELGELFAIQGNILDSSEFYNNQQGQDFLYNVVVTESQSGNQYCLKSVRLARNSDGLWSLSSESFRFQSDRLIIGTCADTEISTYISPALAGKNYSMHVGNMSVDYQSALTPPPTPTSLADCSDDHMDDDFSR